MQEFTADVAGKQVFISDVRPKDIVRTTFLVRAKQQCFAKNGKSYLSLLLGDRTGQLDARVWEDADRLGASFEEGDVVAVSGRANLFQERLQLSVEHLVKIPIEQVELDEFMPKPEFDVDSTFEELVGVFRQMQSPWVKELALKLLEDPEIARRYKVCPAAKTIHHAFLGGLLVHSLQLIRVADAVVAHYPAIDRDIVVFGAAFHDFGKIFELSYDGNIGYSDEGRLVGHIAIGTVILDRKMRELPGFPVALEYQLKHLILSHHGRLEYGSPKAPQTLEAQLLHHLDDMDSKLQSIEALMRSEAGTSRWTALHKTYGQAYLKPEKILRERELLDRV